jgi:hypothetical protein
MSLDCELNYVNSVLWHYARKFIYAGRSPFLLGNSGQLTASARAGRPLAGVSSISAFRPLFQSRMCYTPFALDTSVVVVRSLWLST